MPGIRFSRIMSDISSKYPDLPKSFRNELANGINNLKYKNMYVVSAKYGILDDGRPEITLELAKDVILIMELLGDSVSEISFKIICPEKEIISGVLDVKNIISKASEIIEEISDVTLGDEEIQEALRDIEVANSLAKINPENKGFLYAIKHKFLKYLAYNRPDLIEYTRPVMNNSHKTLELRLISGQVFHVGWDRKERYNVDWPKNSDEIGVYTRDDSGYKIPADLNIQELEVRLFRLCLKLYGGGVREITLDSVRYWWTREVLRKKYSKPDLEIVPAKNNEDLNSNYSALKGTKTRYIIPGVHEDLHKFDYYFSEAIKSGINL